MLMGTVLDYYGEEPVSATRDQSNDDNPTELSQ
jgi:hypothetical protein